jgi:hypothetical protein
MRKFAILFLALIGLVSLRAAEPLPPPPRPGPPEPVSAGEFSAAIKRGVTFLLKSQNQDGSWGTPEKTKALNIMASPPGSHNAFRLATTALAVSALIEIGGNSDEVRKSIERGEEHLMENLPKLRRATPEELYNVWGHGYGIEALARMYNRLPNDAARRDKIKKLLEEQYELLDRFASVDGGWGYYDFEVGAKRPGSSSTSFVNGAILVALAAAKPIAPPPEKSTKRAIEATLRQRLPDGSFLYGEYLKWAPTHGINKPGGSLGRSQACNLALRLWGDEKITDQVIIDWLDRLITRNGWLDMGRKRPVPHESHYAVAGYFYYFGHYYAAGCIQQLPKEKRAFYQDHLAKIVMKHQEEDGSWWDYPLYNYHQPYGTGFALLTLAACKK